MKSSGIWVGGVVVAAAVVVFLATRGGREELAVARTEKATAERALEEVRAESTRLEHDLTSERRRTQRAEAEAAKLRDELATVRSELEEARKPVVEAAPAAADTGDWRDAVKAYPAYSPEGLGDALSSVDWEVVADSMSHMPALIAELARHIEEGRPMEQLPAETIGSIQRYNGPLVTTAMRLAQKGVAGSDVNGAFSNPGFMSNALAATLLALDMPLDAQQSVRLAALTNDFAAREAKRVAGYDETTYTLQKLVDESRLKHEYFQKVFALLTPQQSDALRPEAVRGRLQLDIFCESLAWAGKAGPALFGDRADLANKVGGWVISRGALPASEQERAKALVTAWVDRLPDDFLAVTPDALDEKGMLQVDRVVASAAHVLELLKTLENELDLDDAQRARLHAVPGSVVPYHRPSGG